MGLDMAPDVAPIPDPFNGFLDGSHHLGFQRFKFLREGGPRFLHLLADYFFVFHWIFSCKPLTASSGNGLKVSNLDFPQKTRAAPATPSTAPTIAKAPHVS